MRFHLRPSVFLVFLLSLTINAHAAVVLNEIKLNPSSTDQPFQYIELSGTSSAALTNTYVLVVDGNSPTDQKAKVVVDLTAQSLGSNGLLVIRAVTGNPYTFPAATTQVGNSHFDAGAVVQVPKATPSFLLVTSASAIAEDTDVDANDDGVFDLAGVTIVDAIGWHDTVGFVYGGVLLNETAPNIQPSGKPDAATRFLGNTTALNLAAWYYGDLASSGTGGNYDSTKASNTYPAGGALTPGAPNEIFPVLISQSSGSTNVDEDGVTDTYTIGLVSVPVGGDVAVTVTPNAQVLVSTDGNSFVSTPVVLHFATTTAQTITVKAVDDATAETTYTHNGVITHAITATSDTTTYPTSTVVASVTASIFDNEVPAPLVGVQPDRETSGETVGDSDDPAFWVHPTNPALSLVLTTKKTNGMTTFDLSGAVAQAIEPAGGNQNLLRYNNVDVLYGLSVGGVATDVAVVSDRTSDSIVVFAINPTTRQLSDITNATTKTTRQFGTSVGAGNTTYGLTCYRSPVTGKAYAFINQNNGAVIKQIELADDGTSHVQGTVVRTITLTNFGTPVSPQCEGMVADSDLAQVYIGLEDVGIYKLGAEPTVSSQTVDTATAVMVDRTVEYNGPGAAGTRLHADVEGLCLFKSGPGTGYLMVSSQGDNTFYVYKREGANTYVGGFKVTKNTGAGIDQDTTSDGADVINAYLGPNYPQGLFVCQDGQNNGLVNPSNTNFKFVPFQNIATGLGLTFTQNVAVDFAADAPTAVADTGLTTPEDTPLVISSLLANDTDPQGDTLAVVGGISAQGGTVTGTGTSVTYTPALNFNGSDTLTYHLVDQTAPYAPVPRGILTSTTSGVISFDSGYGSALAVKPGSGDREFYLLTDRGPNVDGAGGSKVFPAPSFNPNIGHFRLRNDGTLERLDIIHLKRADGTTLLTGLPNPTGVGGTGEIAYALDLATNTPILTPLPTDIDGIDSEGLVALADGTFWVSDEYGPWIVHFAADGTTTERVGPFTANGSGHKLPLVLGKRRPNRGMEGLAVTPDGSTLVGMMQSPLYNPSSAAVSGSLICRIVTYKISDGTTKQYTYVLDSTAAANSEIIAVTATEFLVLERDGLWPNDPTPANVATIKKIYRINLTGATDVSDATDSATGKLYGGKTVDELKTRAALIAAGITPVSKVQVVDLLTLSTYYPHDKAEGLALINGGKTLVIANDDDFGVIPVGVTGSVTTKFNPLTNLIDYDSLYFVGIGSATASVTVTPVNDPPTITAIPNRVVQPAGSTGAVSFTIGDPETAAASLVVTATSGNTTLLPNANLVLGGTGASRTITATVASGQTGSAVVTVAVNDGTVSTTTTFTVKVVDDPYILPVASGVVTKALLTTGDTVNLKPDGITPYRMVGIPDGLGAFDNGDGTFTLLSNHELGTTVGAVRAHGSKGAFVSKWIINKTTLQVQSGADLIQSVNLWNGTAYAAPGTTAFQRFCSADLPPVSAFYNAASGKGTQNRIFMNGEELSSTTTTSGRAMAHVVNGTDGGKSWDLPLMGRIAYENALACPTAQDKTIVIGNDDSNRVGAGQPSSEVNVYIGTKTNTGLDIDKAGLTNGLLYGVKVTGKPAEDLVGIAPGVGVAKGVGVPFTLAQYTTTNLLTDNGLALQTEAIANGVTQFSRVEDGAWDPTHPTDFYFVTTDQYDQVKDGVGPTVGRSRLWRLRFTNIATPETGGTIAMMLDGTEPYQMLDNLTIDGQGRILLEEDVGSSNDHNGKIWDYSIASGSLTLIAKHDPVLFGDVVGGVVSNGSETRDEEGTGIIDAAAILGTGWYLTADQNHKANADTELVEGGQYLAIFVPATNVINTPPTATAIADQAVSIGGSTAALAFTINDAETPVGYLVVTTTSSNTALVPLANVVLGGSGAARTITVTAAAGEVGTSTITRTVDDGDGGITSATFTLTVTNAVPTISDVADLSTNEDTATAALAVTVGDADSPAAGLVLTAASSDTTLVPVANIVFGGSGAARTVTITPAADKNGTATITLTVTDPQSGTATDTLVLTVTAVPDAPVAANGSATVAPGASVPGNLAATDADGDPLTYAKITNPTKGTVTVTTTGAFTYTNTAGTTGTDQFTFTANDGTADSNVATVTVTITAGGGGGSPGNSSHNSNCGLGGGLGALLLALFMALKGLSLRRRR